MISSRYIYSCLHVLLLLLSLLTTWYDQLVLSLALLVFVMIVDKMGKGIVLRESIAMLYIATCLVMPLLGYHYYTSENQLAKIWFKYMPVSRQVYFGYVLPAIICFSLAINWPLGIKASQDEGSSLDILFIRVKRVLLQKKRLGIALIIIGLVAGRVVNYLPGTLQYFATLFYFASFTGLLCVFYLPNYKYKKLVLIGFTAVIFSNALDSGMFTIVVYMSITIFSFFLVGTRASLVKKLVILTSTIFFVLVLQNTKLAYRQYVWRSNYADSRLELFGRLFMENIRQGDILMENKAFFVTYVRLNQGFNVGLVMRRFPMSQSFDGGKLLGKSVVSSFVPRFLWPDKPEAGGRTNMKYYAGYKITRFSTNVGPVGEGYGSFGAGGGIAFMFLLGAFIRWTYKLVFQLCQAAPILVLWIPMLFFQVTYSAETDTLQILNSIVKSGFFLWLIYKVFPDYFKEKEAKGETSSVPSKVYAVTS